MTSIQDFLSLATTLVTLVLIVAGVMKLFQIANDMHELKEVLKDMRRMSQGLGSSVAAPVPMQSAAVAALNRSLGLAAPPEVAPNLVAPEPAAPLGPPNGFSGTPPTAEELVRAVHAQHFGDDDFPL